MYKIPQKKHPIFYILISFTVIALAGVSIWFLLNRSDDARPLEQAEIQTMLEDLFSNFIGSGTDNIAPRDNRVTEDFHRKIEETRETKNFNRLLTCTVFKLKEVEILEENIKETSEGKFVAVITITERTPYDHTRQRNINLTLTHQENEQNRIWQIADSDCQTRSVSHYHPHNDNLRKLIQEVGVEHFRDQCLEAQTLKSIQTSIPITEDLILDTLHTLSSYSSPQSLTNHTGGEGFRPNSFIRELNEVISISIDGNVAEINLSGFPQQKCAREITEAQIRKTLEQFEEIEEINISFEVI